MKTLHYLIHDHSIMIRKQHTHYPGSSSPEDNTFAAFSTQFCGLHQATLKSDLLFLSPHYVLFLKIISYNVKLKADARTNISGLW